MAAERDLLPPVPYRRFRRGLPPPLTKKILKMIPKINFINFGSLNGIDPQMGLTLKQA